MCRKSYNSQEVNYHLDNTLVSLRSYLGDVITTCLDGIKYWRVHKSHRCYKCGYKGHIAADCAQICHYCFNKHSKGICIFKLDGFCSDLLRKLDSLQKLPTKAQLELDVEKLKEKYQKLSLKNNKALQEYQVQSVEKFMVQKYSRIKACSLSLSSVNQIINTENPVVVMRPTCSYSTKEEIDRISMTIKCNEDIIREYEQANRALRSKIDPINDRVKAAKASLRHLNSGYYVSVSVSKVAERVKDLYPNIKYNFFKTNVEEEARKFIQQDEDEIRKYEVEIGANDDTIRQIREKIQECKTEIGKLQIIFNKHHNQSGVLQVSDCRQYEVNYSEKQSLRAEIKRTLIRLSKLTHTNPVLQDFYHYTQNVSGQRSYIRELDKQINKLEKTLQNKENQISHKCNDLIELVRHKNDIKQEIITNAKNRAENAYQKIIKNAHGIMNHASQQAYKARCKIKDAMKKAKKIKQDARQPLETAVCAECHFQFKTRHPLTTRYCKDCHTKFLKAKKAEKTSKK